MDNILGILLVVFIVLNFILYHKIFRVTYFGNMGKSIANELIWCAIAACVEVAILMKFGQTLLRIILIIAAVVVGLLVLLVAGTWISTFFEKNKSEEQANGEKTADNDVENDNVTMEELCDDNQILKENAQQESKENVCEHCGEKIEKTAKYCNFCGSTIDNIKS